MRWANELTDRAQQREWMYLIDKRVGTQTLTQKSRWTLETAPFIVYLELTAHPLTRASGSGSAFA